MDPLSHPEDASGPARHHWGSVGPAPRRPSAGATEAQEGAAGPAVSQDGATQLPGPAASSAREEGSVLISGPWEPRGAQSIPVPPPGPRQAECWGFRAPPGGGVRVTRVESVESGSVLVKCAVETTSPGTSLAEFPVLRAPVDGRGVALFQRHVFRTDPTGQPARMHGRALGAPTEGTPREGLPSSRSRAWHCRSFRPGRFSALRKGQPSGHRTRWQRWPGCGRPGTGCSVEGP